MVISCKDFDYDKFAAGLHLVRRLQGHRKAKGESDLFDVVCAFDIETSTLHFEPEPGKKYNSHSFMYIWMWQFGQEYTVIGRTWDDFLTLCNKIDRFATEYRDRNKRKEKPVLVSYVHNLPYEWQFLAGIYPFKSEECFFLAPRKPAYCKMFDALEFRCSYKLSNMSLAKFAETAGAKTRKQSGQKFDYSKIRYWDTELTPEEMEYCIDDVICLEEAIRLTMQKDKDNLQTIPLTSTGYVRRECKAALQEPIDEDRKIWEENKKIRERNALLPPGHGPEKEKPYHTIRRTIIEPMLPTPVQYKMLREAFRGGNTHAGALNNMVGRVLGGDQSAEKVESYDMASCYPAQQLTKLFPMKRFRMLEKNPTRDTICRFIGRDYAVVGEYDFINLRLKNPKEPVPYVTLSKTTLGIIGGSLDDPGKMVEGDKVKKSIKDGVEVDNGRLIAVRNRVVRMTITEIDLEIIMDQYIHDGMRCRKAMVAKKEMLPAAYRKVIQSYFDYKTSMKAASKTDPDIEYLYGKSKNKLNAVYGMSAQNPVTTPVMLNLGSTDGFGAEFVTLECEDVEYRLKRANFPYQWGVYTTAYARQALQEGIKAAGDKMVYCDTDSVKTLGHVDFSKINKEREDLAKKWGAHCKDSEGVEHYVGVFESEGVYDGGFITQGAKRYAFKKTSKGKMKMGVTVSGVTHKMHEYYNESGELVKSEPWCNEELSDLEHFVPGMTWKEAGGTAAVYNDLDNFDYRRPDGKIQHISRNLAIVETSYTLTYAKDYRELLEILRDEELYKEWRKNHE